MSNSAEELHGLYSSWRERAAGGQNLSRVLSIQQAHGIAEVRRAFALLTTIDQQLRLLGDRGHRVGVYRRQLDGWSRVPLSIQGGWSQGIQPDHVVTVSLLDQIEGLAAFFDGKVLDFDDQRILSLRPLVDRADALLTGDSEMDPALASYIRRLSAEIRYALDDEAAGRTFDFTSAVERLWVSFQAAAEKASDAKKSAWRDLAQQIFVGVASSGAVEIATVGLKLAIGDGS